MRRVLVAQRALEFLRSRPARASRAGGFLPAAVCVAALLAVLAAASLAQTEERDQFAVSDHVKLVSRRVAGNVVKLYAELTNCTEVTLTLTLDLKNAEASEPLPLTADSAGRTLFELAALRPIDSRQAMSYTGHFVWQYGRRGDVAESSYVYELPYREGAFRVSQADFGERTHKAGSGSEHAIDWAMPVGTVVCAARAGTVVALRGDSTVGAMSPKFANCSNFVVLRHDDGTFAEYGHLRRSGVLVWLGQEVKCGGVVGFSGSSGYASGPHLHFSVFQNIDGRQRRSIPVKFRMRSGRTDSVRIGEVY